MTLHDISNLGVIKPRAIERNVARISYWGGGREGEEDENFSRRC